MDSSTKRKKLLDFLDKKAFDPVLKASESRYDTNAKKEKLKDVKKSTEKEKDRFHNKYRTPKDIRDNFLSDLNSDPAKKVHSDLKYLDLPRLPELKEEFLDLCEELEVK